MTQFENSEIINKFAAIMAKQDGFVKEAWTWRDIVTELGVGAAVDVGLVAGVGAATGMAGGTGAAAGVAAAMGPIGWVLLGGAALSLGIWYLTRQMDDNLDDLIDRLEVLDTNQNSEGIVKSWVSTLKQLQPVMKIPPTTTDPEERVRQNGQKIMGMKYLHSYLLQMQREWTQVKANLTDWGFDDEQAEHAINETAKAVGVALAKTKQYAQQRAEVEKNIVLEKNKLAPIEQDGVAGKGKKKSNYSSVVEGLQVALNKIIYNKFGGSGTIREDGLYGPNTAYALVNVISSDWDIAKAVAQNAKLNYTTIKDIKYMQSHPNLIRKVYSVMSRIVSEKKFSVIPTAGGTGERKTQTITKKRTQVAPARQLSTRDIREQLLS